MGKVTRSPVITLLKVTKVCYDGLGRLLDFKALFWRDKRTIKRQGIVAIKRMAKLISHPIKGAAQTGLPRVGKWKAIRCCCGVVGRAIPSPPFLRGSKRGCLHRLLRPLGMSANIQRLAGRIMQICSELPLPELFVR